MDASPMGDGAAPGACPLPARLKNDVNVPALLPKKLLVLRARSAATLVWPGARAAHTMVTGASACLLLPSVLQPSPLTAGRPRPPCAAQQRRPPRAGSAMQAPCESNSGWEGRCVPGEDPGYTAVAGPCGVRLQGPVALGACMTRALDFVALARRPYVCGRGAQAQARAERRTARLATSAGARCTRRRRPA